jgi:hypothetical protein
MTPTLTPPRPACLSKETACPGAAAAVSCRPAGGAGRAFP